MKKTIVTILQQRMDKCTTEQFWAIGIITGLDAFMFAQSSQILVVFSTWVVIAVCIVIGVYAIYYVIHRHKSYYQYRADLVSLVKGEPDAPAAMKSEKSPCSCSSLIGTGFYVAWLVLITVAVVLGVLDFSHNPALLVPG